MSDEMVMFSRANGQPLMHVVLTLDCINTHGTFSGMFPLMPVSQNSTDNDNPYTLVPNLLQQYAKTHTKQWFDTHTKKSKKKPNIINIDAFANIDCLNLMLYDHRFNLSYECDRRNNFINKYSNLNRKITNDQKIRVQFLAQCNIVIPTNIRNFVNEEELYDSDQEFIGKNTKSAADYNMNKQKVFGGKQFCYKEESFSDHVKKYIVGDENEVSRMKQTSDNYKHDNIKELQKLNNHRLNSPRIQSIYQSNSHFTLTVHLTGIYPLIYRQIRVPARLTLNVFHQKVLSVIFGYKRNFHSYLFSQPHRKNKKLSYGSYGVTSVDALHNIPIDEHHIDDRSICLFDLLQFEGDILRYIYDLGDQYHHTITLNKISSLNISYLKRVNYIPQHHILPTKLRWQYEAKCFTPIVEIIDGKRNGPPENLRGNKGYVRRLNVLQTSVDSSEMHNRHSFENKDLDFFQTVYEFRNSPNVCEKLFDSEKFNIGKCQKKLQSVFSKPLYKNDTRNFIHPFFIFGKRKSIWPVIRTDKDYSTLLKSVRTSCVAARAVRVCGNMLCQKKQYKMKCCKGCRSQFYCNKRCQKQGWKLGHKLICFDASNF
eukprot:144897_1